MRRGCCTSPGAEKTGVTFQEFTLRLPRSPRIVLRGATALRADGVGKSDGVTFRVFVDGVKQLDVNRTDGDWQPFTVDLTAQAGKVVTVRFETDPGPLDNASFDFALWGGRQIVLTGFQPTIQTHPAPPPLDLRRLTSRQNGSVAPLSGFAGKTSAQVTASEAVLRYQGADGILEYHWKLGSGDSGSFLGDLTLRAKMTGDAPVVLPLAGQARLDWAAEATPTGTRLAPALGGTGAALTRTYSVVGRTATVTVTGHLEGKSLVSDVRCDTSLLRGMDGGGWGPVVRRHQIGVPYYSNPIVYLAHENVFAGAFLDWTSSSASSQDGMRGDL